MRTRLKLLGGTLWTPAVLILGSVLLIVILPAISASLRPTVVQTLMNMTLVLGMFIFIGNSGVISFGHISFMAIGAYVFAYMTIPVGQKHIFLPHLPGFLAHAHMGIAPAVIVAAVAAAIFALIVALPLMRLSGISASIATFAVLVIVQVVAGNWDGLTNGQTPLVGIPTFTDSWSALVWSSIVIVIAALYRDSRSGLQLRASREDEPGARALGVRVWRERVVAFTISGICMGIGGALYAGFLGSFNSDSFYIDQTILPLAMLVVGGVTTLTGAWVGTVAISALTELLRRFSDGFELAGAHIKGPAGSTQVGLGLAMLLILLLRPGGLTAGREVPGLDAIRARLARRRPEPQRHTEKKSVV